MYDVPPILPLGPAGASTAAADGGTQSAGGGPPTNGTRASENRVIVYDLATKQLEACVYEHPSLAFWLILTLYLGLGNRSVRLEGELTSVKISHDSQFALINRAPGPEGLVPCVSTAMFFW